MQVHVKIAEGFIGSKLGRGIQLHWTEEYLPLFQGKRRLEVIMEPKEHPQSPFKNQIIKIIQIY